MSKRIEGQYATGSKILHWLIAAIVILMLILGFIMSDLPTDYKPVVYMIHKSFGITVLGLMFLRLFWILMRGKPSLPEKTPKWEIALSRFVQYGLYVLLFAMPISGWIMSVAANKTPVFFGLFKMPLPIMPNKALAGLMSETHEVIAWMIIVLICLHVLGALKHHFIDKDRVLRSML